MALAAFYKSLFAGTPCTLDFLDRSEFSFKQANGSILLTANHQQGKDIHKILRVRLSKLCKHMDQQNVDIR